MPIDIGRSIRTMACVVFLVTGPEPGLGLASFSDSTEKLARAVVMPPMVIAMCIHDKNVLSLATNHKSKLASAKCQTMIESSACGRGFGGEPT